MREAATRWREQEGATATEYIVLLVFIALAIFVGALILGGGLNNLFSSSCDALDEQAGQAPPEVSADCQEEEAPE